MAKERNSTSTRMIVAGIEIGTTYSRYAYSFRSGWSEVYANKFCEGRSCVYAPTVLLLNSDQSFNSFGYKAEETYADIVENDKESYFYFNRFKVLLKSSFTKRVYRDTKCKDESGREVKAMLVFKYIIKYLKDHLLEGFAKTSLRGKVDINDINFVLTIPAIWDDSAKMFMHEAAVEAEIPEEQIEIALEPEAASIYCQLMHLDNIQSNNTGKGWTREPGVKFMVIDLGGGTADITVHQLQENGVLAELVSASSEEIGETSVDDALKEFLSDLFGIDALDVLKKNPNTMTDYNYFWEYFEQKKREKIYAEQRYTSILIPVALTDVVKEKFKLNEKQQGLLLEKILSRSIYHDKDVSCETGRLIVSTEIFKMFFNPTIDKLIRLLSRIENDLASNVDDVLLVGGFSECDVVQERLRQHFGKDRVVIPFDASLAVLKGAVFFGHRKELVPRRISRFTYGIQIWPKFDESIHSLDKKIIVDGEERCRDVFFQILSKGDPLEPGMKKSYLFNPLKDHLECSVFISDQKDPKYIDDPGCAKLGSLMVPVRNFSGQKYSEIEESLIFGATFVKVEASDRKKKKCYEVTFDLLTPK